MTVMCKPFFAIPQAAMRLGKLRELGPVAFKLYIALWHDSERYSTRELRRTVAQLQALVGGSRNSHAKARAELVRVGLVVAEAYGAEGFVFHLCNPETGKPWQHAARSRRGHARAAVRDNMVLKIRIIVSNDLLNHGLPSSE